ncbi:transcription initiation factor IIB [Batrachochytrium salamandrivorans]|nr:transcription initiation factor IIB [Batrachochytrium salamandrivorans]
MTSLASTAAPPALSVTPPQQQPQLDLNLRLICRDCKDAVPNIVEDFRLVISFVEIVVSFLAIALLILGLNGEPLADDERLLKSKPTEAIIAACLYIACREHSVTRTLEKFVADRIVELGTLAGKSPITLVASCLYFVSCLSTDPKPAKLIAEVAGCTESTLKNAYKLLLEVKDIIGRDLNLPHGLHTLPN